MGAAKNDEADFRVRAPKLLAASEVRALSRLSAWRASWGIAKTLAITAALIVVAIRWPNPATVAACILGIATQQHAFAILAHEATHHRLFETRWVNDLWGRVFAYPLFVSLITYRVIHRTHHNHLYSPIDPDLALMAGYPRGRRYLAKKLLKDLVGITTAKNYLYFTGKPQGSAHAMDDTPDGLRAAAKRDRWMLAATHLALVPVWIATGCWKGYLLLWILPAFTLLQAILRLRAVAEHGAVPDVSDVTRAARTVTAGPIARAILFPHHVHFHVEHHLYPSVPCYRLAACHAALVRAGHLQAAEVTTTGEMLRKVFAEPAPRAA